MCRETFPLVTPNPTRTPTRKQHRKRGKYHFEYTNALLKLDRERRALREAREIGGLFSPFETNPSLAYFDEVKLEKCRRSLVFMVDDKQEDPTFQLQTPVKAFFQNFSARPPVLKRKDVRAKPMEVPATPSPATPLFKEEVSGTDSSEPRVNLSSFFDKVATIPSSIEAPY
jgi:hypothetical protein